VIGFSVFLEKYAIAFELASIHRDHDRVHLILHDHPLLHARVLPLLHAHAHPLLHARVLPLLHAHAHPLLHAHVLPLLHAHAHLLVRAHPNVHVYQNVLQHGILHVNQPFL